MATQSVIMSLVGSCSWGLVWGVEVSTRPSPSISSPFVQSYSLDFNLIGHGDPPWSPMSLFLLRCSTDDGVSIETSDLFLFSVVFGSSTWFTWFIWFICSPTLLGSYEQSSPNPVEGWLANKLVGMLAGKSESADLWSCQSRPLVGSEAAIIFLSDTMPCLIVTHP